MIFGIYFDLTSYQLMAVLSIDRMSKEDFMDVHFAPLV